MRKIKVVLAIRSLDTGGAERQFIALARHIDKERFEVTVCTMYGGRQEEAMREIPGIEYHNLEKKGRYDIPGFYGRYKRLLHETKPDIVYSFMGEMNLFSYWCKPKNTRIIWGFRASDMDLSHYGKMTRVMFAMERRYSPRVDRIVSNSNASVAYHRAKGFEMSRAVVIPNGIDIERFRRKEEARRVFREEYGLGREDIAIGTVARLDPMKGYPVFAKAMKILLDRFGEVVVFAVGTDNPTIRGECAAILGPYVGKRFHWLGRRDDVDKIYSGLDLYVSASVFGEGFSNAIAEAMSSELPCVVTDVGDSGLIVGTTGSVVEPGDPYMLSTEIEKLLQENFREKGRMARQRIVDNFSIERMVDNTQKVLMQCVES